MGRLHVATTGKQMAYQKNHLYLQGSQVGSFRGGWSVSRRNDVLIAWVGRVLRPNYSKIKNNFFDWGQEWFSGSFYRLTCGHREEHAHRCAFPNLAFNIDSAVMAINYA